MLMVDYQTANTEGRVECSQPSLVFLPHCPRQLTNNLLWSNWSPGRLLNLVLVSNSFSTTLERNTERSIDTSAAFIR